ncbi:MAG: hypothetical protein ACHQIK_02110 [Candidatus Acidiferrales bacterium]
MARFFRIAILMACILSAGRAFAAGGACPSGVPVTGNNCYFVAANGSDSNNGISESTPWLHAPGMPNCSNTCATVQTAFGGAGSSIAGTGIIFKGGDTWHFGNSALTPYTGGAWYFIWTGSATSCVYEGVQTSCVYVGVDPAWFTGTSWTRPIFNADNPLSTSLVASCAFQIPTHNFTNTFIGLTGNVVGFIFDNFELFGLCQSGTVGNGFVSDSGGSGPNTWSNLYIHGWTATTATTTYSCVGFQMSTTGHDIFIANVLDGQDSYGPACGAFTFPSIVHMKDNIFRYTSQGVGQQCHDIHDNIFEYWYHTLDASAHSNILECNSDAVGPTPNVVYNNIVRHAFPSFVGNVGFWFCPNTTPEYWFNNILYDLGPAGTGNEWDIAGPPNYSSCSNTGGQFMFNNTLVDSVQPCFNPILTPGGQFLTVFNEHLINTPYNTGGNKPCTGFNDASNVAMSTATATSQGYTSGSGGVSGGSNSCANENTTPCAPTSVSNGTVGSGANHMAYCNALAGYTSEQAIGVDAANACKFSTTDGCAYILSTHSMSCPAQVATARSASTVWDVGAYQGSSSASGRPNPPGSLTATVQ